MKSSASRHGEGVQITKKVGKKSARKLGNHASYMRPHCG
jgi:hypothetical protein